MIKKQNKYSSDFKAKVVLELLSEDMTLSEISSKYGLVSRTLLNWKKDFLGNASAVFNTQNTLSEHKKELLTKEREINELHRQLGKRTAELEWASKKLKSLDFKKKKSLIKSELESISISRQMVICGLNRSSFYYKPVDISEEKLSILKEIDLIYQEYPFYGYRKVFMELKDRGFSVGINQVAFYMKKLGLKTIYPAKKVKTTIANIGHHKYPYLLRELEITRPNQVWSTDITYIKINGGFVYLSAIIDWYSKAILSYKVSNTMDESLVTTVLKKALNKYGNPEIFNTDQGSQYTSNEHIKILKENNILISMDGKGRATDNIAIERFWRSAKYENIYLNEYQNIKELKNGVKKYIEFYNQKRFHQTIDYKRPMEVYGQLNKVA